MLTDLILLSKGVSSVFSNTTVQKHQFFGTSVLHGPTLISIHDYWKNHRFDYNMDLYCESNFNMLSRFVMAFLPRKKISCSVSFNIVFPCLVLTVAS